MRIRIHLKSKIQEHLADLPEIRLDTYVSLEIMLIK